MKGNQHARFTPDESGVIAPGMIIGLVVAALVAAAALPVAITAINDADTTNWTAGQIALFAVIGIVIIAVVVVAFTRGVSGRGGAT